MLLTWMEQICSYYRVSGLFTDTLWTKHLQKQIDPTSLLPNKVQNIPPRTGSGKEANRAVNFPIVPNNSIMPAPYCITLLLPTCRRNQDTRETTVCHSTQSRFTKWMVSVETKQLRRRGELWIVYLYAPAISSTPWGTLITSQIQILKLHLLNAF